MECETLIERTWQIHTPFLQHTLPISQTNLALKCEALKPQTFLGVPAVRSAWQPTPLRNMNGWGSLPSLHFLCNFHPSKVSTNRVDEFGGDSISGRQKFMKSECAIPK